MRSDRENSYNYVENIKFLVYMLENIFWKFLCECEFCGFKVDLVFE